MFGVLWVGTFVTGVFFLPHTAAPDDAPAFTGPGWFADVTDEVGLDFVHDAGPADGAYFMPQIIGSGAALFDFDGDGRLDIYLLQNGGPNPPPRTSSTSSCPDGNFQDVSDGSGLDFAGWNMGVAVGDVNNDGRPDVLVTQYGGVKLFLNQRRRQVQGRDEGGRPRHSRLGDLGRLLRLRPRRLARPRRRQLRRLRPDLAVRRRQRQAGLLRSQGVHRRRRQAVPQPRPAAATAASASRT